MTFPKRAGLVAAAFAFFAAFLASMFLYGSFELTWTTVWASLIVGACAAVVAFAFTFFVARRRYPRHQPAVGALRGGALAAVVLVVIAALHAVARPGAAGILVSIVGQVGFTFLMIGWLAVPLGAFAGIYIERSNDSGT